MSLLKVTRAAAVGLAVATGTLVVAAGTAGAASADADHSDDADRSKASSEAPGGFSPANDVTPGGVPVFGLLESVKKAPDRLSPEKSR